MSWRQLQLIIWPVAYNRQRTVIDPCFNLTQYGAKFDRLCVAPPKDFTERHFDRPDQALPITAAPRSSLSDELPFDSYPGQTVFDHLPVAAVALGTFWPNGTFGNYPIAAAGDDLEF
ncbi:hypothetical protein T07_4567 [Trichinella nelsoni]|uniref:Uncharacterized protein n=1 Tax=Trichinella nelsoni TaxID=6336 RepID=A0A0V0RI32_9BILA|nr:hypothetical protein T07_4567 [Trichinella nelsoni]